MIQPTAFLATDFPPAFDLTIALGPVLLAILLLVVVGTILTLSAALASKENLHEEGRSSARSTRSPARPAPVQARRDRSAAWAVRVSS
jgi:hypothetical protein